MENLIRKRAMAIAFAMSMIMVAFLGLQVQADEPLPATINVTVTDTFAPADDGNAYTILDTFEWFIEGLAAPVNNSNITLELTIGPLPMVTLDVGDWNETRGGWVYELAPDSPAYVGDHQWMVEIANDTLAVNATGMITIWHPVLYNSDYTMPTLTEDTMWAWNLTEAFLPEMDEADAFLTFGVGPEGFPVDWTFTPITDADGYPWWQVTPPANFTGMAQVNVTAQDTNGNSANHMFDLNVAPVNDPPVIHGVIFEEMSYPPMWVNVTELLNVTGVDGNFSWVVELEIMEDQMGVNFTVNFTDLESDHMNISTEITDDIMDGIEVMWDSGMHQYNVTVDENLNGHFLVNYSIMDEGDLEAYVWILFTVEAVNDAPTGEWGTGYEMMINKKTGENVNVSVDNLMDVDGDDLTVIWKIDGTVVADWNMMYFLYNWSAAKIYNVSAYVTDGIETVEIGYFHVNVTVENTAPVIGEGGITGPAEEVKEGESFTLSVSATDGQGDDLTYTWTQNMDTSWEKTGASITVEDLEPGTYTFTVTVSDGTLSDTETFSVTIAEKEVEDDDPTMVIIIIVVVVLLVILLIIILVVMKGKKKEEEMHEESEPMGEEDMAVETGDMPMEEGYEQPMEESYEQPMEESYEQPPVEEPVMDEESMPPAEEEEPVVPEMPEQPPIPPQPEPPIPPQ
jgi:hypothetical protein